MNYAQTLGEKAKAAAPKPAVNLPGDETFNKAVAAVAANNPSIRGPLGSMKFGGLANGVITGVFAKKQMMHMKLLERKQDVLEAALSEAYGETIKLLLKLEGDTAAAPGKTDAGARKVMEQAFDVFGRDMVEITD